MYLPVYELFMRNKVISYASSVSFLMHSLEYLILWSDVLLTCIIDLLSLVTLAEALR